MTDRVEIPVGTGAHNLVDRAGLARLTSDLNAAAGRGLAVRFVPGTAGRFFCGGIDLAELHSLPAHEVRRAIFDLLALLRAVFHAPVPVETHARGHAIGLGAMLVLAADLACMAEAAKLRFPETLLGLCVFDDVVALIRNRSNGRTAERLILSAEAIAGAEAVELGLADSLIGTHGTAPPLLEAHRSPAFPALKALCRRDVLTHPLDAQVDRFMALWISEAAQNRIAAHLGSPRAGRGLSRD